MHIFVLQYSVSLYLTCIFAKQITVELFKNPTLGISITGGINGENLCHPGDPCLYVYNMAEGKPAKMCGQIQIGDKILSVSDRIKNTSQPSSNQLAISKNV